MDNRRIDASLGLAFSLELFKQYKESGRLQAEIQRFPGIKGRLKAFLTLVDGAVVLCTLETQDGRQYPTSKDVLVRFDNEKGPFEWSFQPMALKPAPMPVPKPPAPSSSPGYKLVRGSDASMFALADFGIPKVIAQLDVNQISTWTIRQQQILFSVWRLIDGQRTVREIRFALGGSLASSVVDEAFYVLLELRVIVIDA
ncbi:MAG TPA: hypothetical protein VFN35_18385 [Ktedonobacteraceae bacterium]|nr:hypothetical protein [Ktedonobacteraceae bacterium]